MGSANKTADKYAPSGYLYTPLTTGLIMSKLRLKTDRYEPGDPTSFMRKIVDDQGAFVRCFAGSLRW